MNKEEFLLKLFNNTDKLKKQRIQVFVDTPSHRIHGSYDDQPFILEIVEGTFIAFAIRTDIEDFFDYFIEAITKMFNRNPLCTYFDKNAKLKVCEWCYKDEELRFEHLLNASHVDNLELYNPVNEDNPS